MSAPAWLAPPGATFEEALAVGGDVQAALLAAAPSLPHKDLGRLYPATMQDAVAVVHARLEENKKKAAASKQKSKSKGGAPHSPSDSHFPGARPGGGDPSAFWLYIEVRGGRGRERWHPCYWPGRGSRGGHQPACHAAQRLPLQPPNPADAPPPVQRPPDSLLPSPPSLKLYALVRVPQAGLLPGLQPGRPAGPAAAAV